MLVTTLVETDTTLVVLLVTTVTEVVTVALEVVVEVAVVVTVLVEVVVETILVVAPGPTTAEAGAVAPPTVSALANIGNRAKARMRPTAADEVKNAILS